MNSITVLPIISLSQLSATTATTTKVYDPSNQSTSKPVKVYQSAVNTSSIMRRGLYCLATALLALCFHSATGNVRGVEDANAHAAVTTETSTDRELQGSTSNAFSMFTGSIFNKNGLSTTTTGSECTFKPDKFDSDLVVEFNGNPEDLSDAEVKLMEKAFLETFNDLAGGLCDNVFRTIKSVNISSTEIVETRRRARDLQGNGFNSTKLPARRFSFRLFILGNCRRCATESALFDDAFRRRDLQSLSGARFSGQFTDRRPMDLPSGSYNFFFKSPFKCDCVEANILPDRSVGNEEFTRKFNAKLGELNAQGFLPNVDGSFAVTEVKNVTCPAEFDDFDSEVFVDASGDPDKISMEELDLMRDLFLQSYKISSEDLCDTEFRLITNADVEVLYANGTSVSESRRILRSNEEADRDIHLGGHTPMSASDLLNRVADADGFFTTAPTRKLPAPALPPAVNNAPRFRAFRFRFRVSGKCKGCKAETRLFDDAFRRRLADEKSDYFMDPSRSQRKLAFVLNDDTCFCAINAPEGLPDSEAFSANLDQAIQTEQMATASLPNVGAVIEVVQVDESIPSSAPSLTPSIAPSNIPSVSPSRAPSITPSNRPSTTPSQRPSSGPTEEPSRPTIPTESPVPSPQPSITPTIGA